MPTNVAPIGLPRLRNLGTALLLPPLLFEVDCWSGGARRTSRRVEEEEDLRLFEEVSEAEPSSHDIARFSRKSCVTAMPMDANERDVRSHARNVRSM